MAFNFGVILCFACLAFVLAGEDGAGEEKPKLSPAAKFDEIFRLRLKHDVAEAVNIIRKTTELKKAKNLVEKVLSTVTKDMERLREEQLLKVPAKADSLVDGTLSETDIDAYVNLATDLLIFSNFVLFQPDLSRAFLKRSAKENDGRLGISVVEWALSYCRDTGMFNNHSKAEDVVHLMEQELEFVPRSENYQNPYAHRHKVERAREEFEEKQKELEKNKNKLKKPVKVKSPRLTEDL